MGQFKPMVKMMTTEPTVELKLKKGGHVNMKKGGMAEGGHKKMAMGGGALDMMSGTPALVGRPAVNAPVRAPGKPSMASRRKAMMAKKPAMKSAPPMGMPPMKEGGESKKTHKAEMSKMKGLEKELKSHESKPASKGHKGLKTGGVALGNAGGFKKGGMATGGVKMGNAGGYKEGGMPMVEKGGKMVPEFAADGKGKMKMGGKACATGGVTLGNAGGFKHGGKTSKKAYATGGTVDSGKPVAMPQGAKKPSSPVSINRYAGTFKKGGKVTPAEGNLMKAFGAENKTAMKQAKAQSNDVYSKYQKMAGGGSVSDKEAYEMSKQEMEGQLSKLRSSMSGRNSASGEGAVSDRERKIYDDLSKGAYDASRKHSRELEDALNPLSMVKELAGKAKNFLMPKGADSVTKTKESVTVSPAGKRRGGRAC
jgi:hypothetical protein